MRLTVIALLVSSLAFAAPRAQALLRDSAGKKVGTADFTSVDGGVHVSLKVKGVSWRGSWRVSRWWSVAPRP